MIPLRIAVTAFVAALALSAGAASAQIKFADFSSSRETAPGDKSVVFDEAKNKTDLKHGTLVSLNLMDGTKVTGHVVRFDDKTNRLYVRTRSGEAPLAFEENELRRIDKAMRPVDQEALVQVGLQSQWRPTGNGLEENDNGVVRIRSRLEQPALKPASYQSRRDQTTGRDQQGLDDSGPQNVVEPEIVKQVTYNGSLRTVTYFSTVVSPGERDILDQIQKAENEYLALAGQQALREQILVQELTLQEQQLRAQRLINATMENENTFNYPYPSTTTDRAGTRRDKGVITILPQPLPTAVNILERIPAVDPQKLVRAREELTRLLRNHGAYEDGRLIAVFAKAQ